MNDKRFFDRWAWSQIEAAADGSLDGESRLRMAAAQDRDARLRAAIARARSVHAALRASGRARPPSGLLGALLAIPRRHPRAGAAFARIDRHTPIWATAAGAAGAVALVTIVVAGLSAPLAPPPGASTQAAAGQIASTAVAPQPAASGQIASTAVAPQPAAPREPELAAVQDFAVALVYLNKSAAVTGREVGAALNGGLTAALAVSRDSLSRRPD